MSSASSVDMVAAEATGPSRIGHHKYVLAALGILAVGLSLLVWFHPSFGYASGGVLAGADLRVDLIRLVWWLAVAFAAGSTLILALVPVKVHAIARYSVAYGSGAALAILAMRVFDKLY